MTGRIGCGRILVAATAVVMERRAQMDKMVCDGWNQDLDHTPAATHKIGVGSQKWRVCEECYDAIIEDAAAGKVGIWDCN